MKTERIAINTEIINEYMADVMDQCPEVKDIVVVLNWDTEGLPQGTELPASLLHTNREDEGEVHVQSLELIEALNTVSTAMSQRIIKALTEANNELNNRDLN